MMFAGLLLPASPRVVTKTATTSIGGSPDWRHREC